MNQEINFVLKMPRAEGGLLQALFVYANYRGRYCVVLGRPFVLLCTRQNTGAELFRYGN